MSTGHATSVSPGITRPLPDAAEAEPGLVPVRARAASSAVIQSASAGSAASVLPWLLAGASAPPSAPWLVQSVAGWGTGAGYATASGARPGAASTFVGNWSFLTDPSLSVEEKLARFMVAVQKKLDDDLTTKMNDYKAKYGEGGTETKKDEGGGFLGSIFRAIFPSGGIFDKVFGGLEKLLSGALKTLGGPLLAALTTAVGLPMLAPAALRLGDQLGTTLSDALTGTKSSGSSGTKTTSTSTTSKTGSTTKKGEAGSPDERLEMLEIQRLVEKQNQLFTLVSNLLKGMHETSMIAIQNVK
jgi:hypothetical protein